LGKERPTRKKSKQENYKYVEQKPHSIFNIAVIVGALGYFVDIYDLLLFSIIRVPSLKSMGLDEPSIAREGLRILNIQMLGLLLGGVIWGVLGDKKGRMKVLFASIILYSVGNIANGFVNTVPQYALVRFITGLGLAGELGAGITLVSEIMSREARGYGTTVVASVGVLKPSRPSQRQATPATPALPPVLSLARAPGSSPSAAGIGSAPGGRGRA